MKLINSLMHGSPVEYREDFTRKKFHSWALTMTDIHEKIKKYNIKVEKLKQ